MLTPIEPLQQIHLALNIISALCGFFIVIFILIIMAINKKLVDRVSLRFTLAISFFDCLRAIFLIFHYITVTEGAACVAISFGIHWLTLVYLFLTVAIAFNLQLVFLKGNRFQPRWELYYWGVSLFAATLLLLIPLVSDRFGLDEQFGYCEFKDFKSTETFLWRTLCYLVWIAFSIIYCTVIVIKVILHLRHKVSVLAKVGDDSGLPLSPIKCTQLQRDLKRLIRRISLYCLIPLVTQIGFCVSKIYCFLWVSPPVELIYVSTIGLDLPGILNFIAFIMDPAFSVAIDSIRKLRYPERRVSKAPFLDSKSLPSHHTAPSSSSHNSTLISISENVTPHEAERLHESSFLAHSLPMTDFPPVHSRNHSVTLSSIRMMPSHSTTNSLSRSIHPSTLPDTAHILGSLIYQDNEPLSRPTLHSGRKDAISVCEFIQGL